MSKIRKWMGIILILVGISIIGVVSYKKIIGTGKDKQAVKIFEQQIIKNDNNNEENSEENKLTLVDIDGYQAIAIMEIPSIKLEKIVVEGVGDNVLKYYLGHYDNTAAPGENGNFVVAGHRVSDYTDAFINLYKVKKKDEIIIKTTNKKYTYAVDDIFIVDPDQVEVLEKTENATITLITCTVGAEQRVIVKGTLLKTEEL